MSANSIMGQRTAQFLELLAAQASSRLYEVPLAVARAMAYMGQARMAVKKVDAFVQDCEFEIAAGCRIPVRIVRPLDNLADLRVVMYFHGGGWIVNDRETHDRLIREIAVGAAAAVIFVEYSRSLEARYPVAIEEAYNATCWVAQHGRELGLNPDKIAVMGDSAGGNMAAVHMHGNWPSQE